MIEKKFIGRQQEGTYVYSDSISYSSDMNRFAYVTVSDEGMRVGVNAETGKLYDHIAKGYPIFSPVRNRVGYIADKNEKHFVVIDGKEFPGYEGACCLCFSPNGEHTAYITQDKEKQFVMLNGRRLKPYDIIDRLTGVLFSPDSRHYAYIGIRQTPNGAKMWVMHDGTAGAAYDMIDKPIFSPDSRRLAYRAMDKGKWLIVNDGKSQKPYDLVGIPVFSPDSRRLAYRAIENEKLIIVTDNREKSYLIEGTPTPPLNRITPPFFSPDGRYLIYLVKTKPFEFLMTINDTVVQTFNATFSNELPIVFDADNQARLLTSSIENGLINVFQINITINGEQPS